MSTIELPAAASSVDLRRRTLLAVGIVAIADQVTKTAAVELLGSSERSIGPIRFVIVHNQGGPFGIATGASLFWTALTLVVVVTAIVAIARNMLHLSPMLAVAAVVGGGLGNLIDRTLRSPGSGKGAVIDWIAIDPYPRVFNLADIALRGGALILVIAMLNSRTNPLEADIAGSETGQTGFQTQRLREGNQSDGS